MWPQYTAQDVLRFWSKVDTSRGMFDCWLWLGSPNKFGYGPTHWVKHSELAHRVSYVLAYGDFPRELRVLHRCDNPPCVNPLHLFLGTPGDNNRDRHEKGRDNHPIGELNGRCKLSDAQVEQIRLTYSQGKATQVVLAKQYGMAQTQISRIVREEQRTR